MRSKEKEFGVLVVESDGGGSKETGLSFSVPLFPIVPTIKTSGPDLPTSPMHLAAALATHPVPDVYSPKTVHVAEGLQSYPIPDTKGILMHLIFPHSLRCPADAYFSQVVSHYPHLHRESDSLSSLRLPVDMQGQTHHISGYRLLHWSPVITQKCPY